MKRTQTTMVVNEKREMKLYPAPTLGKVLFNAFFWVLLVIMESYLWIFKSSELIEWVKDLKVLWIGLAIGSLSTIALYVYCYCRQYVVRIRKLKVPTAGSIFAIIVTIIRGCEFIMMVTHFPEFCEFWKDGILPFILFMWIIGVSILAYVRANFIRKKKQARARSRQH